MATAGKARDEEEEKERGSRPVPDPTFLTTDQLRREISALKELSEIARLGIVDQLTTRLEAMDKAIILLQTTSDKMPKHVSEAVQTLEKLHEEKFNSIATQFRERDTRTEQAAKDSKVAIDAALQAQKEAVGEQNKSNALAISKSEAAFTKQIDQTTVIVAAQGKALDEKISSMGKSLDDKISDMKDRIGTIETSSLGRITNIEGTAKGGQQVWGFVVGGIGMVATIVSLFFLLAEKVAK